MRRMRNASRTKVELLQQIQHYEETLLRIAGKPGEYAHLADHCARAGRPVTEDAEYAYTKCARIARHALWHVHPRMKIPVEAPEFVKGMRNARSKTRNRKPEGLEPEMNRQQAK